MKGSLILAQDIDDDRKFMQGGWTTKIQRFNTLRPFGLVCSSECDFDDDRHIVRLILEKYKNHPSVLAIYKTQTAILKPFMSTKWKLEMLHYC